MIYLKVKVSYVLVRWWSRALPINVLDVRLSPLYFHLLLSDIIKLSYCVTVTDTTMTPSDFKSFNLPTKTFLYSHFSSFSSSFIDSDYDEGGGVVVDVTICQFLSNICHSIIN